ncbi:MAG: TolC family protein [Bacteroidota bacterium]
MKIGIILSLLFVCNSFILSAQSSVNTYIEKGLESNLVLKQLDFELDAALHALSAAKAERSINLDFLPQYTLAAGGRRIAFPAGDLLNPVYNSLNELTASNQFPTVENVNELLNPNNFYDVKVRATYPILNAQIGVNNSIKILQSDLVRQDIEIYKSQLKEQIATAYFDILQAKEAVVILESAQQLIQESLRVNQSLFNNQKITRTAVLQNEQDLVNIDKDLKNAALQVDNAKAYLNFLINVPLDSPVELDSLIALPDLEVLANADVSQREELDKLNTAVQLNQQLIDLAKTYRKPELNAFVDLGMQDFNFNVDGNSFYALGGLTMRLNIFDGKKGKENIKKEQSLMQARIQELQFTETQLDLELRTTSNELEQSIATYAAERQSIRVYEKIYSDKLSLYKNGKINYINLLEARNDLINAQLMTNLALFEAWSNHAKLIRVGAISFNY